MSKRSAWNGDMTNVLEDVLSGLKDERPLNVACVPVEGFLQGVRLEPRLDSKLCLVHVASTTIIPHANATVPEEESTVM